MARQLVALAMLLLVASSCTAATLSVRCTAPAALNGGTCTDPVLEPADPIPNPLWVHFSWNNIIKGSEVSEDSVMANPGAPIYFERPVSSGTYRVSAWASNSWGAGCDTSVFIAAGSVPGPVRFVP